MTNREKFAEQILDIACGGSRMAVNKATLEPIACDELECKDCLFNTHSYVYCGDKAEKWANSKYVEPPIDWSKVTVDTPILVRDNIFSKWVKRYSGVIEVMADVNVIGSLEAKFESTNRIYDVGGAVQH